MALEFIDVSEERKALADKKCDISRGSSPYQDGVKFTVDGWSYKQRNDATKDDDPTYPVLTTVFGSGENAKHEKLYLSTITRDKVTYQGEVLSPNGEINNLVKKIVAENSGGTVPDGEILEKIVNALKDVTIVVTRKDYVGRTRETSGNPGRPYPARLTILNKA